VKSSGGIRKGKNFIPTSRCKSIKPGEPFFTEQDWSLRRISVVILFIRSQVLLHFPKTECRRTNEPLINGQLPTANCQRPTTTCQPPTANGQLSTANGQRQP